MKRTATPDRLMLLLAILGCGAAALFARPAAGQTEKPVDLGRMIDMGFVDEAIKSLGAR